MYIYVYIYLTGLITTWNVVPGEDGAGAPIKLCLVRAKIDKKHDRNSIHTFVKPHNVVSFSEELNMLMHEKCSF